MFQLKVLVVEDDFLIAEDIKRCLERAGYTVPAIAFSGEEAIEETEKNKPDLVLMDIFLEGEMDGIVAAEQIRNRFGIPIIFLTAYSDHEFLKRAKKIEPYGYIIKPYDERQLSITIGMALNKVQMEKEQKALEEKYRLVVENANEAIVVVQDGMLKFYNQKTVEITGYSDKELTTTPFEEFVHPDDREMVVECNSKRLEGKKLKDVYDFRIIDKNNSIRWIETRVVLIALDGKPAVLAFISDITDRKQAEKALQESEERLKILFEYAPDGYYLNDLKGNFVDGNKAAEELTGYKREELIGKNFLNQDLLAPGEILKVSKSFAQNVLGKPTGPDEFTLKRKDGTYIIVAIRTYPVRVKDQTLVLGIARDITERKKMEDSLKKSRNELELHVKERTEELAYANEELTKNISLLESTMNSTADGILVIDRKGRVSFYNKRFKELLCVPDEFLSYRNYKKLQNHVIDQLNQPEDFKGKIKYLNNHTDEEIFDFYELKVGRIYEWFTRPQKIANRIVGRVWSVRDITQNKQFEEKLRDSEQRYRRITEAVTDYIFTVYVEDGRPVKTVHSPACVAVTGYSAQTPDPPHVPC